MDRSSIRSFRAQEFAEHGLRELAKSRLDTTREIVFQPLGVRFLDAREDVTKIAALFREDAFRASAGYFCRMDLHLDREVAERLSSIDPRAVESRIEDATRAILERELPRAQGVYLARFEATARGDLEPVARVHLSCRRTDGAPVPMVTREDARRLQENWARGVEKAFGIERPRTPQEREKGQDRGATLGPEWAALRQTLARAQARLFAVYSERLGGKASHKDLADALGNARSARETLAGPARQPVGMLDLDRTQVLDVIQIRIEGGSRYLSGTLEPQRCNIIEMAAARTAGLPEGTPGRPAAVVWPAGPDLHAALYFNQRNHPTRTPDNLDPAQFRDALDARLAPEIRTVAIRLEPMAEGRTDLMGKIHARLPERDIERQAETKQPAKPQAEAPQQGSIVVMVDQGRSQTESESRPLAQQQELTDRAQPKQRDWANERVFAVRLRIPTGAEQLGRLGLSPDEVAHVIQRAVDRAYPFLSREGLRNNFICSTSDRVLDVRIVVPAKLGWTLAELRSPQFQQRFAAGFNQALAQIAPSRIGREKQSKLPGLERALGIAQAPLMLRQFEQEPERAAKHAIGAAFDKLTNVLPQPFRIMRELGRTLGRFGRTD